MLGQDSDLPGALDGVSKGIVAIGDNHRRLEIVERIQKLVKSFEFVTVIHPSAVVAKSVTLGAGTVVMAGAVINPGTKVGHHCIINTRASIDHDNQIEDFVSLGPGAITGGCVKIGRGTAIALGAKIIDGINIGAQTVIGAGATVLADAQDLVVAYGTPARVIRDRKAGDPYL